MNRRLFLHIAAFALASAMSLAGFNTAMAADDEAAIRDVYKAYTSARIAGDAEAWLALWDADGIQMPPDMPARGKDVLMVGVPKAFSAIPAKSMHIDPEEIVIAGDWAYARGTYGAVQVVQGKDVTIDGKFLTIFKHEDDGSWKIYRDIFNFNAP